VDTQALDRSKLEKKDRAELAAIVEAMGGKAGSRAKKADLVDQVLALAGVPDGAPVADAAEVADAAVAGASAAAAASAPGDGQEVAAPEVTVPDGATGSDEEPPAEWELAYGGDLPAPPSSRAADAADQNQQGQGDDGETGNRRRRRRGRDRNREQGEPQGQGQGQGQGGQGGQGGQRHQGNQGNQGSQGGERGQGAPSQPEEFSGEPVEVEGLLDLRDEGYGFLRVKGALPSKDDVYVSVKQVRQFGLRRGDRVTGASRPASRNEKNPALLRIDQVNERDPQLARDRRRFEELTPLFPDQRLAMEVPGDPGNLTARLIDLLSPIGKGQRGLIVSPPKAGKTTVMKQIARSIEKNAPEVKLIVLLVDERPEEVTDFRRWLERGEVVASTFDRPPEEHAQVAELTIERAKRMVEDGDDVCIIVDGITRLTRAYNLTVPASGRLMSGGIDAAAVYPAKRFFGAARNCEEGGSLTILATALVDTNSRMDDHIFEEFKGTGNLELKLDRRMAERRIFPAIDVDASSTRHEELLYPRNQLNSIWKLRRVLSGMAAESGSPAPGLELLLERMKTFRTNEEFLDEVAKAPSGV
jgi:transcription termination factor Rho